MSKGIFFFLTINSVETLYKVLCILSLFYISFTLEHCPPSSFFSPPCHWVVEETGSVVLKKLPRSEFGCKAISQALNTLVSRDFPEEQTLVLWALCVALFSETSRCITWVFTWPCSSRSRWKDETDHLEP